MNTEKEHSCPHCAKKKAAEPEESRKGRLTGWRLGLASACVFLLPLLGALAGIAVLRAKPAGEIIGAIVGLVAGTWLAMLLTRFFKTRRN